MDDFVSTGKVKMRTTLYRNRVTEGDHRLRKRAGLPAFINLVLRS
jgi:hypothetical protein